jgi:prophage regulatory protein
MSVSLLRLPAVLARTGLGRASVYEKIKLGKFPKPVLLGARSVAWPSDEIDAWISSRILAARSAGDASKR